MGEVTRARQCLTGDALAPGNDATLQELQSRRPQEVQRDIPREVLESHPDVPVQLDRKIFMNSLKSAPRGSAPGPGGWTYEHMRVLLDDADTFNLFFEAASSFAQASLWRNCRRCDGNTFDSVGQTRRWGARHRHRIFNAEVGLVARTLAKQFAQEFEKECAPFQYALSTRAGTDCVGHMLRAATDRDPSATVFRMDGIGAYDHVLRAAMLQRLEQMPVARSLLPFVRLSYATPSRYSWWDDNGERHVVTQAEGGEQGDPLMPLLFSIGIQGALEKVATMLFTGEQLCAFLDDVLRPVRSG